MEITINQYKGLMVPFDSSKRSLRGKPRPFPYHPHKRCKTSEILAAAALDFLRRATLPSKTFCLLGRR